MEKPLHMGHVILDRRQEPRFELPGRFRCIVPAGLNGRVIDLSLNGALLESDAAPTCRGGEVIEVLLELDETRPFAAKARVAHIRGQRVGIEFHEIEPPAFEQLSELVLTLKRAPTLAKLSVEPT
jgi:c-di-GMP-binding flagellar brake protein YcgR